MSWGAAAAAAGGAASAIAGKFEGDLAWSRQKRMMQNRHQWEVDDLRKAGLNPILSAGGAPSMASPNPARLPDLQASSGHYLKGKQDKATREVMTLQKELIRKQTWGQHYTNQKIATEQALLAFGLPRARLNAEVAGASHTRWAAHAKEWTPLANTAIQGLGAVSLGKLLGGAASKKQFRNLGASPKGRDGPNFTDPNFKR